MYGDLPDIDPDVAASLEASHAVRAAEFDVQLAEADHRDLLAEEATVAIALYLGCEATRADADRRGVVVCPASRAWTAVDGRVCGSGWPTRSLRSAPQDCPARGAGGAGQGVCASRAQHRSLLIAATQAQANIDALLLKLDAEDADRARRELERDLMEQAREEEYRLAQLQGLASLDLALDTRRDGRTC